MFLYSNNLIWNKTLLKISSLNKSYRKEKFSPHMNSLMQGIRTFLFAPLRGTLTVEAAVVLPLFLFFMIGALQYAAMMETAVEFGTALSDTGKTMAMSAYVSKYGGDTGEVTELVAGALSTAYAQHEVVSKAGDTSAVKNTNMILSSFLQEEEMIDLVLTYQIRSPISMVKLPGTFFIQRAQVRAWTGRTSTASGEGVEETERDGDYVYVTETGSVYHENADCTHLKLSVRAVGAGELESLRNSGGGIYHSCELCGDGAGGTVYITTQGNRYHSSLSCSGLKRTVRQVTREEASSMRACSKCGGG